MSGKSFADMSGKQMNGPDDFISGAMELNSSLALIRQMSQRVLSPEELAVLKEMRTWAPQQEIEAIVSALEAEEKILKERYVTLPPLNVIL